MYGGSGVNCDTDVLLGFSGKVGIIGRCDFCDIRQNRGLKGVGGMHLYRVELAPASQSHSLWPFPLSCVAPSPLETIAQTNGHRGLLISLTQEPIVGPRRVAQCPM